MSLAEEFKQCLEDVIGKNFENISTRLFLFPDSVEVFDPSRRDIKLANTTADFMSEQGEYVKSNAVLRFCISISAAKRMVNCFDSKMVKQFFWALGLSAKEHLHRKVGLIEFNGSGTRYSILSVEEMQSLNGIEVKFLANNSCNEYSADGDSLTKLTDLEKALL